jgi:hypothetical protein
VYLASPAEVAGASAIFCARCRARPLDPVARAAAGAARLWERSEQLCG